MSATAPEHEDKRWSLSSAALWGLGLSAFANLAFHRQELAAIWRAYPHLEAASYIIAEFVGTPLFFIIVAAIRNLFVPKSN